MLAASAAGGGDGGRGEKQWPTELTFISKVNRSRRFSHDHVTSKKVLLQSTKRLFYLVGGQ